MRCRCAVSLKSSRIGSERRSGSIPNRVHPSAPFPGRRNTRRSSAGQGAARRRRTLALPGGGIVEERACGGGRSAAPLTPLVCGWLATDAPAAERVPGQGVARARAGSRAGAGDDPDWRQAASGRRLPAALDLARRASGLAVGQQARELPERPADSGRALAVHRPLARASGPGAAAQECARDCGPT